MIELRDVTYAPGGVLLLDRFSIRFEPGKITAIVGPSGCGKSTLLRVVAGLRPVDSGVVAGVPGRKAFVFQDAALLPWLDTRANVSLPARFGPGGDPEVALAAVGLTAQASQLPRTLSGGQRMRASLARALASLPELVLLDEAFSALDGTTRRQVQDMFLGLHATHGWTVLMVTHEIEDAVRIADRVVALAGPPVRVLLDLPTGRSGGGDPSIPDRVRAVYA